MASISFSSEFKVRIIRNGFILCWKMAPFQQKTVLQKVAISIENSQCKYAPATACRSPRARNLPVKCIIFGMKSIIVSVNYVSLSVKCIMFSMKSIILSVKLGIVVTCSPPREPPWYVHSNHHFEYKIHVVQYKSHGFESKIHVFKYKRSPMKTAILSIFPSYTTRNQRAIHYFQYKIHQF